MLAKEFDALEWWKKLAEHLDSIPVAKMAGQLGLDHGATRPAACPRFVCKSTRLTCSPSGWACLACGSMGGSALFFAAHVAGWDGTEDDDQIRADFEMLAREALFLGFIPEGDPGWSDYYHRIASFSDWTHQQRGIYEGEDRSIRMVALATCMAKGGARGDSIARVVLATNARHCRPPLDPHDIELALRRAANGAAA